MQQSQTDEEAKAKARVDLFRTQAVGIVDRAANGEMFLVQKSAPMPEETLPPAVADAAKAPEAPAAAAALKMPAAIKQAMTDGLGIALERCAMLAEKVAVAEVDDAAPVPPELLQLAMEAEDALGALVEPYEEAMLAAPPVTVPGQPDAAQKAACAPAPSAAATKRRMAMKRLMSLKDTSKALTDAASKLGETIAWAEGASGMPMPTAKLATATKAEVDAYTALAMTCQAAKDRLYEVRDLLCDVPDPAKIAVAVAVLEQIVAMLKSVGASLQPGGPILVPAAQPAQMMAPAAVAAEVEKTMKAMTADLVASMKAEFGPLLLGAQGAAARAQAALTKVEKSVGLPQGAPAGETPAVTSAPPPADVWRTVHTDIAQARTPAAGK